MSTQQADALRLADELEEPVEGYQLPTELESKAAAELRRLHAVCTELLEAINIAKKKLMQFRNFGQMLPEVSTIDAAIAKATGGVV